MNFSDYYKLFKQYGYKILPLWFKEVHFFDIRRGINTSQHLSIDSYDNSELHQGMVRYIPGLTRTIRQTIKFVLSQEIDDFNFVDLGSGKAKSLIILVELDIRKKIKQIVGVELSSYLTQIANDNLNKRHIRDCYLYNSNALDYVFKEKNILFLNNPFDRDTLNNILKENHTQIVLIIYIVPIHVETVTHFGYIIISRGIGWHPGMNYLVFKKQFN